MRKPVKKGKYFVKSSQNSPILPKSSVIMSDKDLGWALKNGDIDKVKEIIESNVSLGQIPLLT